jgi:hypothetical protein
MLVSCITDMWVILGLLTQTNGDSVLSLAHLIEIEGKQRWHGVHGGISVVTEQSNGEGLTGVAHASDVSAQRLMPHSGRGSGCDPAAVGRILGDRGCSQQR